MKNTTIIILIILGISSCRVEQNQKETPGTMKEDLTINLSDEQLRIAGIETGYIEKKVILKHLKVNGKIDVPPQNFITMSAPMSSYTRAIRMMPGTIIRKGDILYTLEDAQYVQIQQDYLNAKTKLAYDESELKRQKELNQTKSASDKAYEQALSNFETQRVLTRSLEEKLRILGINHDLIRPENISGNVVVRSPIDGYIVAVHSNEGKYVQPGEVIAELVDAQSAHLKITAFEKDLSQLHIGLKGESFSNVNPEKKHACEIFLINQNLNQDNAGEAYCKFRDPNPDLIPGTFMNVIISVESDSTFSLPVDAVVTFENKRFVFIGNENNAFQMREVMTGAENEEFIEIVNGYDLANKPVAIKQAYSLLSAIKNKSE